MGGVFAGDVVVDGGSYMPVGERCACEAEAQTDTVGGVRASEADADAEVDAKGKLHVAYRRVRGKVRWHFGAIMIYNFNEH